MRPDRDSILDGGRLQLIETGAKCKIQFRVLRRRHQQATPLQHCDDPPAEAVQESGEIGVGRPAGAVDCFTYWPVRIDQGGEVLAPGTGRDAVQFVHVRDLFRFIVTLAENDASGVFNATGPESRLSMAEMVHGIRAATTGPVRFTWVPAGFLEENGVQPWSDLPMWNPGNPITYVRIDRALAAGLTFRPLADTVRDTLAWHASRPGERCSNLRAGHTAEREAEVLRAWHSQNGP